MNVLLHLEQTNDPQTSRAYQQKFAKEEIVAAVPFKCKHDNNNIDTFF